jgi:hypothetical protein
MGDALHKQQRPAQSRSALSFCVIAAIIFALLAGCGYSGPTNANTPVALSGNVHGGMQAVSGSTIQLYAAGTDGDGSVALPLLSSTVKTDSNGNFTIPAAYGCPSASSPVYVVASGGSPGTEASNNPALVLTAVLGPCGKLSASTPVSVNEVTTVGSVFPLAAYMHDAKHLGSASGDATFLTAVATVPEFINSAQGTTPGTPTPTSSFEESAKLNSLADALADCVNSSGGSAGDGSACGQLFAAATPASGSAPSDTLTAALRIAQNPKNNVANIYSLAVASPPFQPALTTAPTDWALALSYAVAAPNISLPTGTYNGTQEVTLSDSTAGTTLYYTADGTVPTTSSNTYTGPIAVSVSTTLQAIAVLQGSASTVASSTLTITAANPAENLVFQQQPSNSAAGTMMTPAVTVMVEDSNGNVVPSAADAIKLTLVGGSGLQGTLTITPQNGIATFNDLSVSAPGSGYTLLATSPSVAPAVSAPFVITPSVSGTPVTLAFLQQPSNALTKSAIAPAVTVVVEDGTGNPVTNSTNPVTLALTGVSGLAGTLTATPQNGIATFSNLSVGTAGTYTLTATSPSLTSATSASFVITALGGSAPPPPVKLAFLQQPTNASTGATIAPAVTVVVQDSNGNTVPTAVNPVTLTLVGGTGMGGTLSVIPKNGIATFNNLSVSNAGIYTLAATSTSLVPAVSTGFTISAPGGGAPVAAKLAFLQQPSNVLTEATITPAVQVSVEDSSGNVVTTATTPITVSLVGGTGLAGTLTVTPRNGVATFSDLAVSEAGSYTLSATSSGLTSATSSSFTISAPGGGGSPSPVMLAFLEQPSNALTGAPISPAVQVAIEDSNGNPVATATNPVTLTLAGGTGLGGTLTVTPQNGIATFTNLTVSNAGIGYMLLATSPGSIAATSTSFTITAPGGGSGPSAAKLAFSVQPTNALTQATITPAVQVTLEDSNGNVVTNATNPVTLSLIGGAGGLAGTLTVAPQNGIAIFNNLSVGTAGTYTLSATSTGLTSATSTSFAITSGASGPTAAKLAFLVQPSHALIGATITPPVQVVVEDANGNPVTNASNPVTLALSSGAGLGGTLTVTPQNGIATFSDLSLSTAGTYTLAASSPSLTSATSASFTITAASLPTAVQLAFSVQPSNATTGTTITPAVQVLLEDSTGAVVTTATNPVTLALVGGAGLTGTLTVTPQNGVATFSNLSISNAGSYTLSATSPSLASATSNGFTITAPSLPTAVKLAFSVQPSNAMTQATITPAVQVLVEDSSGNVVTTATNPVTLALVGGTGLGGTLAVTPQNGVATFSNLSVSNAGSYTLSATSTGLTSATSAGFTISTPSSSGATYYLSPSGSDSNSGLSASSSWLSPNHSLNCGDTIIAASGSYSSGNLTAGKWGNVNCPAGNNVAWVQCAAFDTCKVNVTSGVNPAVWIDKSYWGIQGFEASVAAGVTYGTCFEAGPNGSTVHHVIFANNVANGCANGGFISFNSGTGASADYVVIVGNIAYNAAQGSHSCTSGISIYQPIASDTNPGTHIFIAGNFSYGNVDASPCAGTPSTDGEAVIIDTLDFSQGGGPAYTQQVAVENNIGFFNGGRGFEVFNNQAGSSHAAVYFKNNTSFGNMTDMNQTNGCLGRAELAIGYALDTTMDHNLAQTRSGTSCDGASLYGFTMETGNASDVATNNWVSGTGGKNTLIDNAVSFVLGAGNVVGTDPNFANPVNPGAPSCGGSANVPACMANVISDYTPTATGASSFGRQPVSNTSVSDPLYPQWLCQVSLPSGLVTPSCF